MLRTSHTVLFFAFLIASALAMPVLEQGGGSASSHSAPVRPPSSPARDVPLPTSPAQIPPQLRINVNHMPNDHLEDIWHESHTTWFKDWISETHAANMQDAAFGQQFKQATAAESE